MIIEVPAGIHQNDLAFVGMTHLVSRTETELVISWSYNETETELVVDLANRTITIADEAVEQITIIQDRLTELSQPPRWKPVYDWLIAQYENYAGRSVTELQNLTDAALLRVLAILVIALLYQARAFDRDMKLRPLADWIRRK